MEPPGRTELMACVMVRAHALQHGIHADAARQLLHALYARGPTFGNDVRRAKLSRQCLPALVPAHRDDALSAHLFRRQHAHQSDGSVTDYGAGGPRTDIGGIGGVPTRAKNIRGRQEMWNEIVS